ncbi:hypothetical protein M378DRAFT_154606 [Amanita muscaria Koide BX008]|uniref:Uncharacterized protein n=1 Tax=Amanita muscaria (strain Koide BX008) TaxID=946122 RepID=A0A0C2T5D9_AMAMK|nr:hypothetical protein M378DRAFT_154606 [Amanita muscaria Koide BX008]
MNATAQTSVDGLSGKQIWWRHSSRFYPGTGSFIGKVVIKQCNEEKAIGILIIRARDCDAGLSTKCLEYLYGQCFILVV